MPRILEVTMRPASYPRGLVIIGGMQLVVSFAAPLTEAGRQALAELRLPRLDAWLAQAEVDARDDADEATLSPPHERALAHALGWQARLDGTQPWAARLARADGIEVGTQPWGLLTPVHWRVGSDGVHLSDPATLDLDEASSRALLDALRPWFESEGFALAWGAPLRWYASHPSLEALAVASLDRVIGRNVERWLPAQPEARLVRRLQNEAQMVLHAHPLNAAREAAAAVPVNSFWLSGCGVAPAESAGEAPRVDERLRASALAQDWATWREAWAALDREGFADVTRLTLCGERGAVTLMPARRSLWQRISAPRLASRALLESL